MAGDIVVVEALESGTHQDAVSRPVIRQLYELDAGRNP